MRLKLQLGGSENGWYSKNGALVQRSKAPGSSACHVRQDCGDSSVIRDAFLDHVSAGRVERVEETLFQLFEGCGRTFWSSTESRSPHPEAVRCRKRLCRM